MYIYIYIYIYVYILYILVTSHEAQMQTERASTCVAKIVDRLSVEVIAGFQIESASASRDRSSRVDRATYMRNRCWQTRPACAKQAALKVKRWRFHWQPNRASQDA